MPNPTRLHHLIVLRERAGLTQAEMAVRCGLPGKQGRKTVSDWETGEVTPRASRRAKFLVYLWRDLKLREEPTRFEAVWHLLVEEWAWAPLSARDHQQLAQIDNGQEETSIETAANEEFATVTPPVLVGATPTDMDVGAAMETVVTSAGSEAAQVATLGALSAPTMTPATGAATAIRTPAASIQPQQRRRFFPIKWSSLFWIVGAALVVWMGSRAIWWGTNPLFSILGPIEWLSPFSPAPVVQLHNGGFEDGTFAPWVTLRECDYQIYDDPTLAHTGRHFLAVRSSRPGCRSFVQDVAVPLQVGESYQAAVWLRSGNGEPRRGRLTLWGLDWQAESHDLSFEVTGTAWVCLENSFTVRAVGNDRLRFEVYLDSHDNLDYWVDDVVVTRAGTATLCPLPTVAWHNLRIEQPSGQFYAGSTLTVQGAIKHLGPLDLVAAPQLRYWVAAVENGASVDGVTTTTAVMPLLAGETSADFLQDVPIPFHLDPGRTYFVVVDVAAHRAAGDQAQGFLRASLPFTVNPCFQQSLYCDVALDHWAYPEIESLFAAGISRGCRSYTEPFQNRPFCPDETVKRWMVVFFFLRHLKGAEYRPDRAYQGVFVDVPPTFDHQGALWIEEFDQMGITLASDDCPASSPERRFCPNLPVKRGDFVRYLAQLQQWDLSAPAIQVFEDVPTDAPSARAVAYLWRKGDFDKTDPTCPDTAIYRRFCPNAPLRRASAAVMMSRALGLVE